MKPPISHRKMKLYKYGPTTVRLGDILLPEVPFKPSNYRDVEGISGLAFLVSGFNGYKTYLTLLGMDALKHNISKCTDKGVIILSSRGKQIKIQNEKIVDIFRQFQPGHLSDTIYGIPMYLRIAVSDKKRLEGSLLRKVNERLINMCEWPDRALVTWALHHLLLPGTNVPHVENVANRYEMINRMIRLSVSQQKADRIDYPEEDEVELEIAEEGTVERSGPTTGYITFGDEVDDFDQPVQYIGSRYASSPVRSAEDPVEECPLVCALGDPEPAQPQPDTPLNTYTIKASGEILYASRSDQIVNNSYILDEAARKRRENFGSYAEYYLREEGAEEISHQIEIDLASSESEIVDELTSPGTEDENDQGA
jgi:hypothetical protein